MRIKELRLSAGLTQKDLATLMHVKRSTVSMWETGSALPTADKLIRLSKVLGCTVDELLISDETSAESA